MFPFLVAGLVALTAASIMREEPEPPKTYNPPAPTPPVPPPTPVQAQEVAIKKEETPTIREEFPQINLIRLFDEGFGINVEMYKDQGENRIVEIKDGKERVVREGKEGKASFRVSGGEGILNRTKSYMQQNTERYLAISSEIGRKMNEINDTISVINATAPDLVEQNRDFINAWTATSQQYLDKGFSIATDTLDKKLKKNGIQDSSAGLRMQQEMLMRRGEEEVQLNFKRAELAQGLKQGTIENFYKMGSIYAAEGGRISNEFSAIQNNLMSLYDTDSRTLMGLKQMYVNAAMGVFDTGQKIAYDASRSDAMLEAERLRANQMSLMDTNKFNQMSLMDTNRFNQQKTNDYNNQQLTKSAMDSQNYWNTFANKSNPMQKALETGGGLAMSYGLDQATGGAFSQKNGLPNLFNQNNRRNFDVV